MGEKIERELKWAVLGTGIIANEMAQALEKWEKTLCSSKQDTQQSCGICRKIWSSKIYDKNRRHVYR